MPLGLDLIGSVSSHHGLFDSCTKRHADYSDDDDDEDTSTMKAKQWQEDYDRYAKESPLSKEELMMEAVYNSGVAEKHPRRVSVLNV